MGWARLTSALSRTCASAIAIAMLSAGAAYAEPTATTRSLPAGSELNINLDTATEEFRTELAAKQAKLDDFTDQLQKLDNELEVSTEEYNSAVDQLNVMHQSVSAAEGDLTRAKDAYKVQSELLGTRADAIYREGSFAIIEVLLDSKSVGDFVMRVKFLNTMGIRDADIAASLSAQREQMSQRLSDLQTAESAAESLEFELKARQIEIMLRIDERQKLLADAQQDLLQLLDEEAARRKTEESAVLQGILANASAQGIVSSPGTPVETALAYHGVPYLWGGETPSGFDCSGLVLYVFRQHGVKLPHYSGSQFQLGTRVPSEALASGDVVFFGSPIHHVGIYMGGGYYIHAPRTGDFVKISRLADRSDYAGARRYTWTMRVGEPVNAVSSPGQTLKNLKTAGR